MLVQCARDDWVKYMYDGMVREGVGCALGRGVVLTPHLTFI